MSPPADPHTRVLRNVVVRERRTSVRMERVFWLLIEEAAKAEGMSIDALLSEIDIRRGPLNLTAAARLFAVTYAGNTSPSHRLPARDAGGNGRH